jgi:hypothetical protein
MIRAIFRLSALVLALTPVFTVAALAQAPALLPTDVPSLLQLLGVGAVPALVTASLLSTAASLFVAVTPTPHPDTPWGRVYQLVEWVAIVTRNTKQTGIPVVDALHNAALATLNDPGYSPKPKAAEAAKVGAALLALALAGSTLSACGTAPVPSADPAAKSSLQTGMANFNTAINSELAALNANGGAADNLAKLACGASAYADAYFKLIAPLAGASSGDLQTEKAAMAGAEMLCAAPPSAGTAPAQALGAYVAVQQALGKIDPAAATLTLESLKSLPAIVPPAPVAAPPAPPAAPAPAAPAAPAPTKSA